MKIGTGNRAAANFHNHSENRRASKCKGYDIRVHVCVYNDCDTLALLGRFDVQEI